MTLDEAKKAIKNKATIDYHIGENDIRKWAVLTCLSDDETGAYYKPNGCGLFHYFLKLEDFILL